VAAEAEAAEETVDDAVHVLDLDHAAAIGEDPDRGRVEEGHPVEIVVDPPAEIVIIITTNAVTNITAAAAAVNIATTTIENIATAEAAVKATLATSSIEKKNDRSAIKTGGGAGAMTGGRGVGTGAVRGRGVVVETGAAGGRAKAGVGIGAGIEKIDGELSQLADQRICHLARQLNI